MSLLRNRSSRFARNSASLMNLRSFASAGSRRKRAIGIFSRRSRNFGECLISSFRLILVGDGPEREHLTEDAARLAITEICRFAGHRNDVRPWYRTASVFALPSHSEGSPNVVLEAMAAGVPVIATEVGGVPEIMQDGVTGLIVPPQQPRRMAEGLATVVAG